MLLKSARYQMVICGKCYKIEILPKASCTFRMGKIEILNIPSCIWLQRKAAVMVSAQNSFFICFLKEVSCSGFEEHHFQCMPVSPSCPNLCFSTCSAFEVKVHLTSPDSKSGGDSMFPFMHKLSS